MMDKKERINRLDGLVKHVEKLITDLNGLQCIGKQLEHHNKEKGPNKARRVQYKQILFSIRKKAEHLRKAKSEMEVLKSAHDPDMAGRSNGLF